MRFVFWRADAWGEVFVQVWGEVFDEVFGLVLLGHSEQTELRQKLLPKIPAALHSKIGKNPGKIFMMRFCRGTLAKISLETQEEFTFKEETNNRR